MILMQVISSGRSWNETSNHSQDEDEPIQTRAEHPHLSSENKRIELSVNGDEGVIDKDRQGNDANLNPSVAVKRKGDKEIGNTHRNTGYDRSKFVHAVRVMARRIDVAVNQEHVGKEKAYS